ncbi:MAG: hypothetical protein QNK70_01715 [Crocinitomicaceae bacterium]|tara:strand:+ start:6309 stop:6902 length:594 start_codon:yes stop_codon:yes gene_type:complete
MRLVALLFLFISINTSCNDSQIIDNKVIINNKVESIEDRVPLRIDPISFDRFYQSAELYGTKSIPKAQSNVAWRAASKNKKAAWCYVDCLNKRGVLYNGYCLADIEHQNNYLLADSIYQRFQNHLLFPKAQLGDCDSLFLVERNANGNFYNLGYHSFWVRRKGVSGDFSVVSVNHSNADVQVSAVDPGNGYFIRLLK